MFSSLLQGFIVCQLWANLRDERKYYLLLNICIVRPLQLPCVCRHTNAHTHICMYDVNNAFPGTGKARIQGDFVEKVRFELSPDK